MININNPIMRGMSGQIGKQFVVRNYNGKQYLSKFPRTSDPALQTDMQRAMRSRFKDASVYAKECMLNPDSKKHYQAAAKTFKLPNAYTAAIRDFMRNTPQIN